MRTQSLTKIRDYVKSSFDKFNFETALFWNEKLLCFAKDGLDDYFWHIRILVSMGQYHRALTQIDRFELIKKNAVFLYLTAYCHFKVGQPQDALIALEQHGEGNGTTPYYDLLVDNLPSAISLLKGKIYNSMDNRRMAIESFTTACHEDPLNFEALECLIRQRLISRDEEGDFICRLSQTKLPGVRAEKDLLKMFYRFRFEGNPFELPAPFEGLKEDNFVLLSQVERLHNTCQFDEALKLASRVMADDPYNLSFLPLFISLLVQFKKSSDLFYLAHKLVNSMPEVPLSWYAVGAYYYLIKKYEQARQYLAKATSLSPTFGIAWVAYGHAFASDSEHDQAMASYFRASQIMKGSFFPLVYIALEYLSMNNFRLAEKFMDEAHLLGARDSILLNELGCISLRNGKLDHAESCFQIGIATAEMGAPVVSTFWEPLYNNLAHTYRKMDNYEEALEYHHHALSLVPKNGGTLSSIGFLYALMGQYSKAVDYFHKALSVNKDDIVVSQMMSKVMMELSEELTIEDDLSIPFQALAAKDYEVLRKEYIDKKPPNPPTPPPETDEQRRERIRDAVQRITLGSPSFNVSSGSG